MVGKLHKYKSKEIPAPTGGTVGTRHLHKFKNATRDQFFRLRLNQYGPTKHWVALLKVKPPPARTTAKSEEGEEGQVQGQAQAQVGRRP